MTKKQQSSYIIKVWGESESDWCGAQPSSIEPLLMSQAEKPTTGLKFQIAKTQIELALNAGKVDEALKALEVYQEKCNQQYQAPLNVFPKDRQNGQCPYIGAHSFFGAFRDCADYINTGLFYKKKGDKSPSKKHFRKVVRIRPHHVFLYRNGGVIKKADAVEGQQPIGEVRGFAKYEVIYHPFSFEYKMLIATNSICSDFLNNKEKVIEALYQSSFHGQGGRRGAGYGEWKVVKHEIQDTPKA